MTTIQILIVAFVALSFAYLILKVWDDIRENEAEKWLLIRCETKAIDIVDFPSMPARAKNGRFLPKIQTATEALAIEKSRQMGIASAMRLWNAMDKKKNAIDSCVKDMRWLTQKEFDKEFKGGPVDVSDELFPKRGKDGKFVKAMPKARMDNFKGL